MTDWTTYIINSIAWATVGGLVGVQIGLSIHKAGATHGPMGFQKRFNFVVGLALLSIGIILILQSIVAQKHDAAVRECFLEHAQKQTDRNVEETQSFIDLFNKVRGHGKPITAHQFNMALDEWEVTARHVNEERKNDNINACTNE